VPRFNNAPRIAVLATVLAAAAGCSEYTDRRDMISITGGDAVQTDKVTQMVDPWPRHAGDRNIAYNGAVAQAAQERYRTGRVIPPNGTGTSATYQQQQNNSTPLGPTVNQSGASTVK
jgi:hypothetical protein